MSSVLYYISNNNKGVDSMVVNINDLCRRESHSKLRGNKVIDYIQVIAGINSNIKEIKNEKLKDTMYIVRKRLNEWRINDTTDINEITKRCGFN